MLISPEMDKACKAVVAACTNCAAGLPFDMAHGSYHVTRINANTTVLIPCTAIEERKALWSVIIGDKVPETGETPEH